MPKSTRRRPTPQGASGASPQDRQRAISGRLAGTARRTAPGAARRASGARTPPRTQVLARPTRSRPARIQPMAMLLRFISCGLICLAFGLSWFLFHRDQKVTPAGALFGVLLLLSGFVVGGLLWYAADARRRSRDRKRVDDEQIVFSFVVFVGVPAMVLVLILGVWLIVLLTGAFLR